MFVLQEHPNRRGFCLTHSTKASERKVWLGALDLHHFISLKGQPSCNLSLLFCFAYLPALLVFPSCHIHTFTNVLRDKFNTSTPHQAIQALALYIAVLLVFPSRHRICTDTLSDFPPPQRGSSPLLERCYEEGDLSHHPQRLNRHRICPVGTCQFWILEQESSHYLGSCMRAVSPAPCHGMSFFLLRFLPSIVLLLEWVGSNHRSRSQSPLPYHLATFQYKPSCKLFILQKQQQDLCAHHLPTVSYLSPTRFLLILCCFFIVRYFLRDFLCGRQTRICTSPAPNRGAVLTPYTNLPNPCLP